jgi:hypothetical protein
MFSPFHPFTPASPGLALQVPPSSLLGLAHILESWTADIISAVEFDSTGNYLATGDKGGRVVLFERNDMVRAFCAPVCIWSALLTAADLSSNHLSNTHPFDYVRKRAANTSSTPSSSRTNQSSITSNRSRLRRRSTRFDGANDRIPRTSCFRRMVRRDFINIVINKRSNLCDVCARVLSRRQNHQAMESLRKVVAGSVRVQLERWATGPPTTIVKTAFAVTPHATSR